MLDAEEAGFGCSTRNGGQISTSIKPGFDALARRHGAERALGILREGQQLARLARRVRRRRRHRLRLRASSAAFTPRTIAAQYEALARRSQHQPKGLEVEAHVVPRAEQRSELGTDVYYGGVVYAQHASIDPARYHQGCCERVRDAGATVVPRCPVTAIAARRRGVPRRDAAAARSRPATWWSRPTATPAALTPWLQRRVIPIGSYIIATEPLPPDVMARLMPRNRIVSDTRKVVYYYRASPDRTRILFGGRVSPNETDPRVSGPLLHAEMVRLFPELARTRISHSWCGFVAYTFDELMHVGQHDGLYYAMGYCGSGVGMASYLGMRVGQQVLGRQEGATAFDGLAFQTRPFYRGNPWFLGAVRSRYYRWRDGIG